MGGEVGGLQTGDPWYREEQQRFEKRNTQGGGSGPADEHPTSLWGLQSKRAAACMNWGDDERSWDF